MDRRKMLVVVALLAVSIVPLVFGTGLLNVAQQLFSGGTAASSTSSSSSPTLFVTPASVNNSALQSGSKFTVHINISSVTDLWAWQINVTWNPGLLSVSRIIAGEFLNRTTSANKTSSAPRYFGGLGHVINSTDNTKGYTVMTETILNNTLGGVSSGISTNGRVVSIEFLVTGYGSTDLVIRLTGALPTTLLDSAGGTITLPSSNVQNGYFRNKYPGDVNGDKSVGSGDFSALAGAYGSSSGQGTYNREADFNLDGTVGSADFSVLAGNYGKTFP